MLYTYTYMHSMYMHVCTCFYAPPRTHACYTHTHTLTHTHTHTHTYTHTLTRTHQHLRGRCMLARLCFRVEGCSWVASLAFVYGTLQPHINASAYTHSKKRSAVPVRPFSSVVFVCIGEYGFFLFLFFVLFFCFFVFVCIGEYADNADDIYHQC